MRSHRHPKLEADHIASLDLTKKTDPVSPFRLRQLSAPFGSSTHARPPGSFDVLRDMRKRPKLDSETVVGVSLFLLSSPRNTGPEGWRLRRPMTVDDGRPSCTAGWFMTISPFPPCFDSMRPRDAAHQNRHTVSCRWPACGIGGYLTEVVFGWRQTRQPARSAQRG